MIYDHDFVDGLTAALARSEDRSRQLEADLVAMRTERDALRTAIRIIHEDMMSLEDGGFAPKDRLDWKEMVQESRAALTPPQGGQKT